MVKHKVPIIKTKCAVKLFLDKNENVVKLK